jgi:hypothetical protein
VPHPAIERTMAELFISGKDQVLTRESPLCRADVHDVLNRTIQPLANFVNRPPFPENRTTDGVM